MLTFFYSSSQQFPAMLKSEGNIRYVLRRRCWFVDSTSYVCHITARVAPFGSRLTTFSSRLPNSCSDVDEILSRSVHVWHAFNPVLHVCLIWWRQTRTLCHFSRVIDLWKPYLTRASIRRCEVYFLMSQKNSTFICLALQASGSASGLHSDGAWIESSLRMILSVDTFWLLFVETHAFIIRGLLNHSYLCLKKTAHSSGLALQASGSASGLPSDGPWIEASLRMILSVDTFWFLFVETHAFVMCRMWIYTYIYLKKTTLSSEMLCSLVPTDCVYMRTDAGSILWVKMCFWALFYSLLGIAVQLLYEQLLGIAGNCFLLGNSIHLAVDNSNESWPHNYFTNWKK